MVTRKRWKQTDTLKHSNSRAQHTSEVPYSVSFRFVFFLFIFVCSFFVLYDTMFLHVKCSLSPSPLVPRPTVTWRRLCPTADSLEAFNSALVFFCCVRYAHNRKVKSLFNGLRVRVCASCMACWVMIKDDKRTNEGTSPSAHTVCNVFRRKHRMREIEGVSSMFIFFGFLFKWLMEFVSMH